MPKSVKEHFKIEVGYRLRTVFRNLLDEEQEQSDLQINYSETKGWGFSLFVGSVSGPQDDVNRWIDRIEEATEMISA